MNLADCITEADVLAWQAEVKNRCRVQGREIVFGEETGHYGIPLERCKTYEDILGWVLHLCQKTWFDDETTAQFILVATHHNKLKVPRP